MGKRRGRERSPGEDLLLERSRLRAREVIRFEAELAPSKDKAALVIIMPWTTSAREHLQMIQGVIDRVNMLLFCSIAPQYP